MTAKAGSAPTKVEIGGQAFVTRRPADLAAQHHRMLGLGEAEVKVLLAGHPMAGQVARVLWPWLAEHAVDDMHTLAVMIEAAGVTPCCHAIGRLYGLRLGEPKVAPTPEASHDGE